MKKLFLGTLTAALLVSPLGVSAAQASTKAASASTTKSESTQAAAPAGFCLPNFDNDNRVFCFLGGSPQNMGNCTPTLNISQIVIYYRCGQRNPRPTTPFGCLNLNADNEYTCLLTAQPAGDCTRTFSILGIVNNYHCTTGGGRILPRNTDGVSKSVGIR